MLELGCSLGIAILGSLLATSCKDRLTDLVGGHLPAVALMATVPFWLRHRSAEQGRRMREAAGEAAAETVDANWRDT
ncbi:hypothetical protein ABZ614_34735 [Streptomyces sp. NPDC013178]|uniref:hypothetical protein n=1 Tax=Streptomyces sp. NPDC013178 TaxID=3155118 RepID=UPI0033DDA5F3